jgi:hypothetical protein
MPRLAVEGKIGGDFTDHRREFESVAGEPAAEDDVRMFGMAIDHEMADRA